jgi:hypothetical protein
MNPVKSTARQGSHNFFRTTIFLRPDEEGGPAEPDLGYIQSLLDSRTISDIPLRISKVDTASRYDIRSAVANKFVVPFGCNGHVILVGDGTSFNYDFQTF